MKKLIAVTCLLLCLVLVGCSSVPEKTNNSSNTDSTLDVPSQTVSEPIDSEPAVTKIFEEKAIEIASEHWGIKSGDVDEQTGFPFLILPVQSENENYRIDLKWLVNGTNYSTVDTVEIDAFSGEVIIDNATSDDEYENFDPIGVSIIENIDGSTREIAISDKEKAQELWSVVDTALDDIDTKQTGKTDTSYIYMFFYNDNPSESQMFGIFTIYKNGSCCVGEDFATLYKISGGEDIYTELLQEIKDYT